MSEVSYVAKDARVLTPESASVVVGDTRLTGGRFTEPINTHPIGAFILGESQLGTLDTRRVGFFAPGVVDVLGVPTAVSRVSQTFTTDGGGSYAASMEFAPYLRMEGALLPMPWPAPVRLAASRHAGFPGITRLNFSGTLIVVYRLGSDHQATYDGDIYARRSTDEGLTWTPAEAIAVHTDAGYDMRDPSLICLPSSGDVLLTYFERNIGENSSAWVARSTDGGLTWQPRTLITEMPLSAPAVELMSWSSGVNPRLLQPVYGGGECLLFYSDDGGATWAYLSTLAVTAQTHTTPQEPWVVYNWPTGTLVCLMRTSGNIAFRTHSLDNGSSWSEPTPAFTSNSRVSMAFTADDDTLHAFYRSYPDFWNLFHRSSTDLGVTWSAPDAVDSHPARSTYAAPVDVGSGTCGVAYAYEDATFTTSRVEYTRR
jgi:hypothetical protein